MPTETFVPHSSGLAVTPKLAAATRCVSWLEPSCVGSCPLSALVESARYVSLESSPSWVGTLPLSALLLTARFVSATARPSSVGMVPLIR